MLRQIRLFLMALTLSCLAAVGSHGQAWPEVVDVEYAGLQKVVAKAIETSVFENGKIRSLTLSFPNEKERVVTFEHSEDGRSVKMIDGVTKVVILVNEYGRISEITFPNGRKAVFDWLMMPTGYWVPLSIKVDGKDLCRRNALVEEDGSCQQICEAAAAASAIAIGQCAASGPTSSACWGAVAVAAAATYRCYRCTNPQIEWPPES